MRRSLIALLVLSAFAATAVPAFAQGGRTGVQFSNPDFRLGDRKLGEYKDKFTALIFVDGKPESIKALRDAIRIYREYAKSGKFHGYIVLNYAKEGQAAVNQAVKGTGWLLINDPGGQVYNQNFQAPLDKLPVITLMDPTLTLVWSDQADKFEDALVKVLGVDKAAPPVNPESEDQAVSSMMEALQVVKDRGEFTPVVERLAGITPKMLEDPAVMVAATQVVLLLKLETENRKGIERALEKFPKAKNVVRIVSRKAQNALNAPLPGEEETAAAPGAAPPTANTRESLAARKLAAAEELQLDGRDVEAYEQFKDIASRYRGTPAAETAGHHVGDYEADPTFMKKFNAEVGEEKAQAMLRMARSYKQAGRNDLARKAIDEMLASYPDSGAAREAKAEGLDKL